MLILNKFISYTLFSLVAMTFISEGLASQIDLRDSEPPKTIRLITDADHKNFLISTLNSATKSVMISSYEVSPKIFHNENIAQSIINAAQRGVSVYIYFENRPYYSKEDYKKLGVLEQCCAKFETNCNHSKCVLKDNDTVAIGSYNWLSYFNDTSSNATIVTTGPLACNLSEDIWEGMRFYQSLAHGNNRGISNFFRNQEAFQPKVYDFDPRGKLALLRTPEAHHIFLNQVFENTRNNIIMFSPFVRLQKLQETFTPSILQNLGNKNIRITLVTLPAPCSKNLEEQNMIFALLNRMHQNYTCFSYHTKNDFHAKTLESGNVICEGSFNWLTAVSKTTHDANNYEVSIVVTDNLALNLHENFHGSALGQIITPIKAINRLVLITPSIPEDFNKHIKIYSGAKYNRHGFCVKLDGDYICDGRNVTVYFETQNEAKQAAYDVWLEDNPQTQQKSEQIESKGDSFAFGGGIFGQPGSGVPFGQTSQPTAPSFNFGQPSQPVTTGGAFSFGERNSQQTGSGILFGQTSQPATIGFNFGQPSQPVSTGGSFAFGVGSFGQPGSGVPFGQTSRPAATRFNFAQPSQPVSTGSPFTFGSFGQPGSGIPFGQTNQPTAISFNFGQPK